MKAKSDLLLKKRSEVKRAILTQRKVAQRQRRERERSVMRQARERQDKINRQKEVEVRRTEIVRGGNIIAASMCLCELGKPWHFVFQVYTVCVTLLVSESRVKLITKRDCCCCLLLLLLLV